MPQLSRSCRCAGGGGSKPPFPLVRGGDQRQSPWDGSGASSTVSRRRGASEDPYGRTFPVEVPRPQEGTRCAIRQRQRSGRPTPDHLKLAYEQVHNRYAEITEFRAKLLGLLPLATGTGAFLLLQRVQDPNDELRPFLGPIGIFGFVVTLGLFIYELRGMQRCRKLEEQGEALEIEMKLGPELGPFRGQPPRRLGNMLGPPAAGLIIYIATAFTWLLLALYGFKASPNLPWALAAMGAFVLLLALAWILLWLCLNGAPTKASSSDRR